MEEGLEERGGELSWGDGAEGFEDGFGWGWGNNDGHGERYGRW